MSEPVIKKTQEKLGKFVTKPPLSDKLLGKPPFRYLHDILNVVVNEHGFLKGLFTEQELSSENIKDKEAKIAFLQKWIDATSLAVGEELNVRPSKIVAGHEVDNTNLLLQAVAKGIELKIDSAEAVKQTLSQSKSPRKSKEKSEAKREKVPSKSKVPTTVKESEKKTKGGATTPSKTDGKRISASKVPGTKGLGTPATPGTRGSTRTKDAKPSSDRTKAREKKDVSRTKPKDPKGDKERRERKEKEEKAKTPKTRTPDQSKTGKPATPSRTGKENSPPMPADNEVNGMPTGIVMSEEVPHGMLPKSAGSIKSEVLNKEQDEIAESIPIEVENTDDGNRLGNDGPPSLLNIDERNAPEESVNLDMQETVENDHVNSGVSQPEMDPAILKAMGQDDQFNGNAEPSDSGVGSLESPKGTRKNSGRDSARDSTRDTTSDSLADSTRDSTREAKRNSTRTPTQNSAKSESLPNVAEAKNSTRGPVPVPPTPGPRPPPLKAYHPDLEEDARLKREATFDKSQAEDIPERPKTGMGIRPRTGRKSARPPSARPAPPKVRERRDIPQEEMPRPSTAKPLSNVILDSEKQNDAEEDEDENFTVGNTSSILDGDASVMESASMDPTLEKDKQELLEGDQDAKGILVAQILETKKELEDNRKEAFSPETPGHRRVPIEQAFQGDASRRREKELIQKDVEKLTSSIQALTRSVNPLAKMLDYLQEDFDSMQKELESWRKENKQLEQSLKAEESMTEQQLEPLKSQLLEMDEAIYDQRDRISAIKSVILRNDERSGRLLGGINIKS